MSEREKKPKKKRSRLSQQDVPSYSLEQALRVPKAIFENYAGVPTAPLKVASALNVQPGSGSFRMLCGAAIAYGFTEGGYNVPEIKVTPLCRRILKPLKEGDDYVAKVEALLLPRVINEFLTKYNGSPIPRDDIANNVLEKMGVPIDKAAAVLGFIIESAESLNLITEIKGKKYVDLTIDKHLQDEQPLYDDEENDSNGEEIDDSETDEQTHDEEEFMAREKHEKKLRKVFITHGKNKKFVDPIKKLLAFGELEPVVSVEKQSVSKPVPDKVLDDMRNCGSAIIHVDAETKLIDSETNEHVVLNPNVLIEIGAAMALYKRRFILLVKEGVTLPSNLQGLYEVRYSGNALDGDATIKLLEAINDMKKES
jgi:predicted nucleotide-binding protein